MANILKKVLHNTSMKSPQDMVLRAAQSAEKLTDTATDRQQEELAKYLSHMKVLIFLMLIPRIASSVVDRHLYLRKLIAMGGCTDLQGWTALLLCASGTCRANKYAFML